MSKFTRGDAQSGNLVGILAVLFSMASFTANDTLLKLAAGRLPLGELIFVRNICATVVLAVAWAVIARPLIQRGLPWPIVSLRLVGEVCATFLYLGALLLLPIGDVTAIAQFTPLALTAAAAVFLGEPVGWRRWLAATLGLCGVLLIIRPGTAAFSSAALLVLGSIVFVVLRDLSTRQIPKTVSTLLLTLLSSSAVTIACLGFLPFETWVVPDGREFVLLAASGVFLIGGYLSIIAAMRSGDIAVVSPFRYSVILYAIAAGFLVWDELPDLTAVAGIVIVVATGLYTLQRERARSRSDRLAAPLA